MIVVEKIDRDEYSISFQDSRCDHKNFSILNRVKNAFKLLTGKPIYYSEVCVSGDLFNEFIEKVNELTK